MSGALARTAYSWLLRLGTPLYLARLWWRGRKEPLYRAHLSERLGGFDGTRDEGRVWVHAVSLGETRAAGALIQALRRQRPEMRLLLTHGTATGRAAGVELLRAGDDQAWLPDDTPGAVRRFVRHHQPALGVLMETEVWPNLLHGARAAGVPMVLANARLSGRSAAKGRRLAVLMHPAIACFTQVLAQTEADAARLRASGAQQVQVLGNLKFDMTPKPELLALGQAWGRAAGRPVALAAVTREGEEAPLLQAWRALPAPRPLLWVVPRHPQRFDEVAALVGQAGFTLSRRSAWASNTPSSADAEADVWLGDTLGEMPAFYAAAGVALLGGSFAPLGGQNLIEAAACGCPVVMGPHTFNFAQAAELALAAGAAVRVDGIAAGVTQAVAIARGHEWAERPEGARWSSCALAFAATHRGAAQRMAQQLLTSLR
jgi:3-deoxy-D-manno-octulosonic-acid transferase